jgi:energy-coupling factor transport system ATP-binding protein
MALAGLLDPSGGGEVAGVLRVDGHDPRSARDRSALLLQDPEAQIVMARVGDDVAFGLEGRCVQTDEIWPRVAHTLEQVGAPYTPQHPTRALSGGEKQRLALAGTFAMRPSLLLLDEPTSNLDPEGADLFRTVLRRVLRELGCTLLMVEHRVDRAAELVDRVIVLRAGGGVVADGTPDAVFSQHGDALARDGVWVAGRRADPPPPATVPPPTRRTLLIADGVTFTYPGGARPAIPPLDVQVNSSEVLAVSGPNGSGKTTLALLLGGLLRPTRGAVLATESLAPGRGREPVWRWRARRLVGRVGSVFQNPEHQFLAESVFEELLVGPLRAGIPERQARATASVLLERLHLAQVADANPFTLSGGEQRRLSVGTALATAPAVVILDEPTFGQDLRTWREMLVLLAALRQEGRALCIVSHDREFTRLLADRTLRLRRAGGG